MKSVIDTIFNPIFDWLNKVFESIMKLTVPVSHPVNPHGFFKPFAMLGHGWIIFVSTACVLAATYGVLFIVMSFKHGVIEFKVFVKWW
ncbi:hypothetical protein ACRS52_21340 [Bacillus cytotoxicus]|uniref:Uncharacterized protein n=1 Tax=Bacillus cytotoxicus TaxID=580165 RepID=A0AAX2CPU5_9BACI|nr:hypothetical protein [Bacillus cytotoxicus]QTR81098.1 hypothetical protein JC777_00130 [Bacillus cytotoxicus]QTR85202.1 hypothetical protein JC774_00130 [Bacillus cytotoxicus]SCM08594.1 Uncharacterized protein BCB44BAC_04640 [Bacillus cytotoxicus]